jgi:hypothetical protein
VSGRPGFLAGGRSGLGAFGELTTQILGALLGSLLCGSACGDAFGRRTSQVVQLLAVVRAELVEVSAALGS